MHWLITGGSGFIGRELCKRVHSAGHEVTVLSRDLVAARRTLPGAVRIVDSLADVASAEVVVNLAGASIADKRWSDTRKALLLSSRIETTRKLVEWMQNLAVLPQVLVSGSAVGWYGPRGDEELTEQSSAGNDFPAELCRQWEAEADKASALGIRVCKLRTGIVLSPSGGALAKMIPLFRWGLGGPIGTGKQWMSWIHREDIVQLIVWLATTASTAGAYNGTGPLPVRNAEFAIALAQSLNRPAALRTPAVALDLLLGEMASIVTTGQRVLPSRALADGFKFRYATVREALEAGEN